MVIITNPLSAFAGDFVGFAEVAHLVEHDLAKVGVAGSSPVFRSNSSLVEDFFWSAWLRLVVQWALVVKLVDTQDLKSCLQQCECRFKSGPGHSYIKEKERGSSVHSFSFFGCIHIVENKSAFWQNA